MRRRAIGAKGGSAPNYRLSDNSTTGATARPEIMKADGRTIEVLRIGITAAGRGALAAEGR